MTPQQIAEAISRLTVRDLAVLQKILRDDYDLGLGVREPRRPKPESPGDSVALAEKEDEGWPEPKPLPEDYWESAQ
jgi:hypothetical protein